MAIRIIVADDHTIVRQSLCSLLGDQSGIEVVGQAADGREAVRLTRELKPDVVVLDLAMPGLGGIEAARRIRHETPAARILALSMHREPSLVTEMLRAGVSGYLLKTCIVDDLVKAVRAVMVGQKYLCPAAAAVIAEAVTAGERGPGIPLSSRQREVLQLLAEGLTIKQIAVRLSRSPKTIDMHRRHIMDRLDLHSVAELTKYAVRKGLTALAD